MEIMHVCLCVLKATAMAMLLTPSSSSSSLAGVSTMENDGVLRKSLVSLAAITALTGVYTQSLNKMWATYLFGVFIICCFALPDWPFFNRPLSQWRTLSTVDSDHHHYAANHSQSRLKLYPVRLLIFTPVFAFAFYKWWHVIRGY